MEKSKTNEKGKKSFRWYEFDVYGEKNSSTNEKIADGLKSVYDALFQMMGYAVGKEVSLEELIEFAKMQGPEKDNGTLADVLTKQFKLNVLDVKKEEEEDEKNLDKEEEQRKKEIRDKKSEQRKKVSNRAKIKLSQMIESGKISESQGKILESYLQAYEAYGTGARDNVVTSATILSMGSLNTRIGCGQGKTDISKAFAMAKSSEGKRTIITSSTPELAAQSFDELYKGMNQANLNVVYLSGDDISYAFGEKGEDGKFTKTKEKIEEMSTEKIKEMISKADVVISDLTSLVNHRENGLYVANKEKDVLLQDEQDADLFNNLWNVEIKGKSYDENTHKLRIEARKIAAEAVAQIGNSLKGDKISQSVSIDGKAPKFKVNGNTISISGTDININSIEGIDVLDMQEFLLDAMLASKVFNQPGKDYVVVDGKVNAISPATGSKEDIPEGVIQAIAVTENSNGNIDKIQKEYEIEKVVSKLSLLKECFAQINGMSATYGQIGSEISKEFLNTLTYMGVSPELIPVQEIYKAKGRIPNFENIKETFGESVQPEDNLTISDDSIKKEKVEVTINGRKVEKVVSPHVAAILRDIESHTRESIIIATNDREKTIEITKVLQEVYKDDKERGKEGVIAGYSGVPQEKGAPKLFAPPNPAEDKKLDITPPKIIIGDHSIGRGVTPNNESKVEEHLIVAQMPSRSEALLEQFLGRVGRKKNNGSVSFVFSSEDEIVQEYIEKNGKEPNRATEIIDDIYQEKTEHALESTKSDIELSRAIANSKFNTMPILMAAALEPDTDILDISNKKIEDMETIARNPHKLEEFLQRNPEVATVLESGMKNFDEISKIYSKQYKSDSGSLRKETLEISKNVVDITLMHFQRKNERKLSDTSKEIAGLTINSRYENIVKMVTRAKELSDLYTGKVKESQSKDTNEINLE